MLTVTLLLLKCSSAFIFLYVGAALIYKAACLVYIKIVGSVKI